MPHYNYSMPAPVLATKLYVPPPRPKIVLRSRLTERLDESQRCKLTLVSAPAGFGKTTLVSEWIAGYGGPVAWLSLDVGDNDPARFLTYLVSALQTLAPKIGEGIFVALQSPQLPGEALLTTLLNEIAAIPDHFTLVLDDYHVIDSPPVDQVLTFLVEHQPPRMHLVIATREDPPLPLAHLRARGQLSELRAADLRFTPAEAAEFLIRVMGLELRDADIAALETRTEGWIAGLQLAAFSMQGREDIASFIQAFTGSHRFVLDYLVDEVLQRQPEQVRSFLLQTAMLDRFCAALCNAVTEREDGKEMLGILERNNLFLIPLDDRRQWYRYHHLFADVLQAHWLEAQPDCVAALHGRASAWYEGSGLRSDAIRHALAAKDFERAAGLIELAWPAAEKGSIQQATWLGWVKTLPEALLLARPVLNACFAYALLWLGELESAQARFQDAERWLEPAHPKVAQPETQSTARIVVDQDQWKSLPAIIAIGRAYIAQARGNVPDAVRYASRVLEFSEADPFRHSQASLMLGMTYWASGNLNAAERVFADYTLKLRQAGNIPDAISTTVVLADIRLALGRLHEAIIALEQLLQFVMNRGEPISPDTADLHRELCELVLEQGDLEAAAQHLQRSKELGEKAVLPVWRYRWCMAQARLNAAQGDLDGALAHFDEAERLFVRTPLPDFCPISAMKARIWVVQGRLIEAQGWVREQGLSVDDDPGILREFEHITLARILIAQYLNDRAEDSIHSTLHFLDRLLQTAKEGGRVGSMIEILVLQALACQAQGSLSSALTPLERALNLAEPEGYVRIFMDEGQPMAELLTRMEAKGGTLRVKEYIRKLLSAFELHKEIFSSGSTPAGKNRFPLHAHPAASSQPLIEPLSERELEVLGLFRTDLNGPEIARELMVSLNTLRTHTQNIYAKLGVNNRRAAVRRAEELDL